MGQLQRDEHGRIGRAHDLADDIGFDVRGALGVVSAVDNLPYIFHVLGEGPEQRGLGCVVRPAGLVDEEALMSRLTVLCAGDIDYADDLVIVVAGILVPRNDESGTIAQIKTLTIPVVVPHRFKTIYEVAPLVGERETGDDVVCDFMVDGHDKPFCYEERPLD